MTYVVPDGLGEIQKELPLVIDLIARTARWVHPEIFNLLPIWCPDTARGLPRYDARWSRVLTNSKGVQKVEENIRAANSLVYALGVKPKPKNWTVCHIWGYDDANFAGKSKIVQDRRFYSCIGNMVWLPTPLKGFTDAVPEVKRVLRHCAFHLYGWVCEHDDVRDVALRVMLEAEPDFYPKSWPTHGRKILPIGTAPASPYAFGQATKARARIRKEVLDDSLELYPREEVRSVLDFWKVDLEKN